MRLPRLLPVIAAIWLTASASATVVTSFFEDWKSYDQDFPPYDLIRPADYPDFFNDNWVVSAASNAVLWIKNPNPTAPTFGTGLIINAGTTTSEIRSTATLAPGQYEVTMRSYYAGSESRNAFLAVGGVFLQNNHLFQQPDTYELVSKRTFTILDTTPLAQRSVLLFNPFRFNRGATIMEISIVPIPEASSLMFFFSGLATMALVIRRRR